MARHLPVPSFNSVVGLRAGARASHRAACPMVSRQRRQSRSFEMVPGLSDAEARPGAGAARLTIQSGFHTAVICEPDLAAAGCRRRSPIERCHRAAGLLEEFLDAHAAGWQIPDPQGFKANVRGWLGQPGWSLYLARVDGRPAATGILYVHAQGRLLRRCRDRSDLQGPRPADRHAAPTHRRRQRGRRRLRAAARHTCRPATATWSGWACACCSSGRYGASGVGWVKRSADPTPIAQLRLTYGGTSLRVDPTYVKSWGRRRS